MARSCTHKRSPGWHDYGRPPSERPRFSGQAERHTPGDRSMKLLNAAIAAVLALLCGAVQAQAGWPAKPITLIVPFPPGGGTDAFARPLSAQLSKQLGKQVIIDNRGGAGGTVGAAIAAKAAPDGYTFFVGAVHHAIAPAMYPKLDYNIQTDFIPVAMVSIVPQVIVVNPNKVP